MTATGKNRDWLFTSYKEEEPTPGTSLYMVYQREKCPRTNRLHWQGFVQYKNPRTLKGVQNDLKHQGLHLEKRLGTPDDARNYCMKEDSRVSDPVEHGSFEPKDQQGKRNDLEDLRLMVLQGKSQLDCFDAHFGTMCRYNKAIGTYRMLVNKKRKRDPPVVRWFYGESGTGKSETAMKEAEALGDVYELTHGPTGTWWDGYDSETIVVFDDYRPNMMKYAQLLKLLNNIGNYRCDFKGGSTWLAATHFFITSDKHPAELFPAEYDRQLERRITEFREFSLNDNKAKSPDTVMEDLECNGPTYL